MPVFPANPGMAQASLAWTIPEKRTNFRFSARGRPPEMPPEWRTGPRDPFKSFFMAVRAALPPV